MKVFLFLWWLILSKFQLVVFHDVHYGQDLNLQQSLRTYQKRERKEGRKETLVRHILCHKINDHLEKWLPRELEVMGSCDHR